ncbi:MAG: group II intron reverse transcriptase/maturase [Hahellaceae bacterium]|jgi:group II intron reverse transcriptase/maturase|nr:group II intron reverse transcriptase/maturase [Hahellaceae bacterium]MCP5209172.1 group II intron reverse transcriptase/maturase [Hahellaceae bacterium]MCP5213060.1 group II intron reverse transcriptase/maturase [Hahellaceae bacterium]MCP5213065.1 group II intron reverse transcriptase/maturase [Hahellaceae bacterium]
MQETQSSNVMSTSLLRLAMLGREHPQRCFTNINQYLTKDLLRTAYHHTRKDGAVGIDGQTATDYAENLEDNLESLLDRAKSGRYVAPPVRRAYVPKGHGKRPIGIPTFEDKVLQRAIVMLLERLYEPLFHPHSFGYRPNKSAHQALEYLRQQLGQEGGHIVELDIQGFFDHLDKHHLREFLQQRIGDGVILRLINKWLKAGVMEGGAIYYPESGSPQGGVISPLLANVYLHHVLDRWFETEVRPRLIGRSSLIRFADDALLILRNPQDASRVMSVLPKRFGRYELSLHPKKTCVTVFQPKEKSSIDFLGFTHYWSKTRRGYWCVQRKTMKSRFARAVKSIEQWCRLNRHRSLPEQQAKLSAKLRGHYAYFGVSGNIAALKRLKYEVERVWVKWLRRRSQRHKLDWECAGKLLKRYALALPKLRPVA